MITRRQFTGTIAGLAGLPAIGSIGEPIGRAYAAADDRLNILGWEAYNSANVLDPFRSENPGALIHAETGTSDRDMVDRLRSAVADWDLINVIQPWARGLLYPQGLIAPLNRDRFMPYFDRMSPRFAAPYPLAVADDGSLLGLPQRYGPLNFVVNTDRISQEMAEDQGWDLFLDPAMAARYGILTFDNWNIIGLCLTAGLNPFAPVDTVGEDRFNATARRIFGGSSLTTGNSSDLNRALIDGDIDAYFTGGIYTVSPARLDGARGIRAITPRTGPVDGKGGVVWVGLTSVVNNPDPPALAEDFLEFVQRPEICKIVAFTDGAYNPVSQMGNPAVLSQFSADELDAIQWDTLDADMDRSLQYREIASYDRLLALLEAVKSG